MSSSAPNPMAPGSNKRNTKSNQNNRKSLSDGAIAAIAVTIFVGIVVALISLYLWLYYRKKQRRASLEAIGAQNLYITPKPARSSQRVVTREVGCCVSRLPSTTSQGARSPLRGSYRSDAPLLRGSRQSTTAPLPTASRSASRAVSGQATPPPRPARPSWPHSVLEANSNLEELVSTYAPLKRPVAVYSPTSPRCSSPGPSSVTFFDSEAGMGQVVHTFRHPTPTLKEQEGFMSMRERAQAERTLGANPGMAEVGFKREYYTMYNENEDLRRESWRNILGDVKLSEEAQETVKWTKECSREIGVAK